MFDVNHVISRDGDCKVLVGKLRLILKGIKNWSEKVKSVLWKNEELLRYLGLNFVYQSPFEFAFIE